MKRLARIPLLHQPGEAWTYGLSVDVLGRVVEMASGKTLDEFFEQRIFEPLGMDDTHFFIPPDKMARILVHDLLRRSGKEADRHLHRPVAPGRQRNAE